MMWVVGLVVGVWVAVGGGLGGVPRRVELVGDAVLKGALKGKRRSILVEARLSVESALACAKAVCQMACCTACAIRVFRVCWKKGLESRVVALKGVAFHGVVLNGEFQGLVLTGNMASPFWLSRPPWPGWEYRRGSVLCWRGGPMSSYRALFG